jgi:glycosyltransferase involved in cell wall biosynthesis
VRHLFVLHPLEKYGPSTSGAIAIISREISKCSQSFFVLGLSHSYEKYIDSRTFYVSGNKLISKVIKWFVNYVDFPYPGQASLLFGAMWNTFVHKFDSVIFFNDARSALVFATCFPKKTVVVWWQNVPDDADPLIRLIALSNVVVLVCSDFIGREVRARCDSAEVKVPVTVRSAAVHREIVHVQGKALRLIFVGRLDPNKGVDFCIKVVAELVRRQVKCNLTIIGGQWFYPDSQRNHSEYVDNLHNLAHGLPVTFTGHLSHDDVYTYYMNSDIQLVPSSVPEPAGLVAIEGLVNGCFVLSSNLGGLPEYVRGYGQVVDGFDVKHWADVVSTVFDNGGLEASRLARVALARKQYSWRNTCQALEDALCRK